jgi:hypothetical protein
MHSIKNFLDAANESAAAVNRKIIEITQRNLNLGFDLAKSLTAGAMNPSEIVRLQTNYWRKQFDALTTQAEEARNRLFGFSATKPKTPEPSFEPFVEEPAKKSPTRLQKGDNRAAQAPATARLGQKSGTQIPKTPRVTGRTAVSGFSALDKKQSEIQKRRTPTDRLKRIQKSPGGDPVDEEAKPRAARTEVKARPSSGPAPQGIPTDISFGILDGNAVRFTNLEAWWLVDGTWRPISPDEVLSNAAVMREARFKQLFPNVPLLPKKAFQSRRR